MDNLVYLTCTEVAKLTGTDPSHVYRDFSSARKRKYIFCGRECTSYLKEDVEKIYAEKLKRSDRAKKRYSSRPVKMRRQNYDLKNKLPHKEYIKLLNAWYGMMRRCYTNDRPDYHHYREYGITMCHDWLNDFETFAKWSLENGFSLGLSIDRINNNKGYSPDNCRWVNRKIQNNNSSQNKFYEYNGESHTIGEWASKTGINYDALFSRIHYLGWSLEKALSTPVGDGS